MEVLAGELGPTRRRTTAGVTGITQHPDPGISITRVE
ncbi:hypothetical protein JOD27_005308 [Lentzea nigeriaca]|nr:hypothetical protein [Lentzea nigeriaca]